MSTTSLPVLVAALVTVAVAAAQPIDRLDPPPGPVTPTGRFGPRIEVNSTYTPGDADSSFVISQSGSYYLANNITGQSGKNGIKIAASDVTLDLNGFALIGVVGSLDGINVPSAQFNLAIRNGTIRSWGSRGVNARSARYSQFEQLRAYSNGSTGFYVGDASTVVNCAAGSNTGPGFDAGTGSTISRSAASDNGSPWGIFASHGSTITECAAYNNAQHGIAGGQGTAVLSCTAYANDSDGIDIESGSAVNCTSNQNGADGINTDTGCLVSNCNVWDNNGDGIDVDDASTVRGCHAYSNTGGGIYARGFSIRMDENQLISNGKGIESNGFNFIIRNYARGNTTNYDLSADDRYGQIVTPGPGFSNPNAWANFEN